MRPLRLPTAMVVLALFAAAWPAGARAGLFGAQSFTLKNGMQVVVIPDHRAPVVTQMVYYKVGAADEKPTESGIAHFLEHLMFKGTKDVPDGQFSYIVARNGGTENAFTTYDYTAYFQNVARDRLPIVMKLEADRMTNLVLSKSDVTTERQVVDEERRMRVGNDPGSLFGQQMRAAQFYISPYGRPVIGWPKEFATVTRADVIDFYHHHYAPNNAILVVAGDITADQLKPLAEKYYGVIPKAQVPPRNRPQEPRQLASRRVTMHDPRVTQPTVEITYLAPTHATGPAEEAYGLEVLADVLSGSTTSRLYRHLVVEQNVAASAGAWYDGGALDTSRFGFWIVPAEGVSAKDAEAALRKQIAQLLDKGITQDELDRVKARMKADLVYARDSVSGIARWFGSKLAVGLSIKQIESWPQQIDAVTVAQVDKAARAVLVPQTEVTGVLLPQKGGADG